MGLAVLEISRLSHPNGQLLLGHQDMVVKGIALLTDKLRVDKLPVLVQPDDTDLLN